MAPAMTQPIAAEPSVAPPSVVVATLRSIRVHDRRDFEQARAMYVHENSQPAVFEVRRTLLGPSVEGTAVIFISVNSGSQFKVEWANSYGLLAPAEWTPGKQFVL